MMLGTSPEYVLARRVLLDALEALDPHREAMVLVGAQAVYHHTGEADIAVAPTTTDADIALEPSLLCDEPLLETALRAAGFTRGPNPGTWLGTFEIAVDLMVPEALSGQGGRRGARLPVHGNGVARRTLGLEPALVDNDESIICALDQADRRSFAVRVAGPAALLAAKAIKIEERLAQPQRLRPKDALDMLRLLQAADTRTLADAIQRLVADPLAGDVTRQALAVFREHGCSQEDELPQLAADAVGILDDPDLISASFAALCTDLLALYDSGS